MHHSVRVPSSSPGRANSRRAYLHLKVARNCSGVRVQLLFHIMGVVMGQCRSGEFSGFVKTTKTLSL